MMLQNWPNTQRARMCSNSSFWVSKNRNNARQTEKNEQRDGELMSIYLLLVLCCRRAALVEEVEKIQKDLNVEAASLKDATLGAFTNIEEQCFNSLMKLFEANADSVAEKLAVDCEKLTCEAIKNRTPASFQIFLELLRQQLLPSTLQSLIHSLRKRLDELKTVRFAKEKKIALEEAAAKEQEEKKQKEQEEQNEKERSEETMPDAAGAEAGAAPVVPAAAASGGGEKPADAEPSAGGAEKVSEDADAHPALPDGADAQPGADSSAAEPSAVLQNVLKRYHFLVSDVTNSSNFGNDGAITQALCKVYSAVHRHEVDEEGPKGLVDVAIFDPPKKDDASGSLSAAMSDVNLCAAVDNIMHCLKPGGVLFAFVNGQQDITLGSYCKQPASLSKMHDATPVHFIYAQGAKMRPKGSGNTKEPVEHWSVNSQH
jgi:hypothetical protein